MTSDVDIRPAVADDLAAIRSVVDEAFTPYIERVGVRPFPMDADYRALIAAGQVWVAERAATGPCGVVVLIPDDGFLLLDIVAVADRVRRTGVGAALMSYAEEHARRLRLPEVRLYTNQMMWENIEYYPTLGYVEGERFTYAEVYHRVIFTKSLR